MGQNSSAENAQHSSRKSSVGFSRDRRQVAEHRRDVAVAVEGDGEDDEDERVKNTITGHIRTPITNANDGQRYGRHGRLPHASSPTNASASRSSPMIRKPVANHQWTNSAFGSILHLFEVLQQPRREHES